MLSDDYLRRLAEQLAHADWEHLLQLLDELESAPDMQRILTICRVMREQAQRRPATTNLFAG